MRTNWKSAKASINVYLAGKIKRNDWRQEIVDIRNTFCADDYDRHNGSQLKFKSIKYNDNIDIVGPFFLSCDHGCYHGERSHGVGLSAWNGCYGEELMTEDQVHDICLHQIRFSDIVFAYINDNTCYGTLSEIGYAAALGKKIIILFDTEDRKKDMWFINEYANKVYVETDYLIKYNSFKDKFSYIINDKD